MDTQSNVSAKSKFVPSSSDTVMSAIIFAIAFLFVRWFLFTGAEGFGVTLFTVIYVFCSLIYANAKKIKPNKYSFFWLIILLLTGASFGLWPGGSLWAVRTVFLFFTAVYWTASLFSGLAENRTGNFILGDIINMLFVVPLVNFATAAASLTGIFRKKAKKKNHTAGYIALGLLLFIPVALVVLPMLVKADGGYFEMLVTRVLKAVSSLFSANIGLLIFQLIICIPVGLYIGGLILGYANKKTDCTVRPSEEFNQLRFIPEVTSITVLAAAALTYLIFIMCQIPYFFSAFQGKLPSGFSSFSQYARAGFFELCFIAGVNLLLLIAVNFLNKTKRSFSFLLRVMNIVISSLTLLIIVTAMSKMLLYIREYGLTQLRVFTSLFMLFLFIVFVGIIVLQFRSFSVVRLAAVTGAVLLGLLCSVNIDRQILAFNTDSFIKGHISEFDYTIALRAGPSGYDCIEKAIDSGRLSSEECSRLKRLLDNIKEDSSSRIKTVRDTYFDRKARENIKSE